MSGLTLLILLAFASVIALLFAVWVSIAPRRVAGRAARGDAAEAKAAPEPRSQSPFVPPQPRDVTTATQDPFDAFLEQRNRRRSR